MININIRNVTFNIGLTKDEKCVTQTFYFLSELAGIPSKRTSFAIHHANAFFRIDR